MKEDVEAIIIAGGKGTRLREIVSNCPKPMALVGGRPFIEWILLMLREQGVKKVVIATGYMAEHIESYFATGAKIGMDIDYSLESSPLGTGGAIRNALGKTNSRRLLILNGDSYLPLDLPLFLNAHIARGARVSISLVKVEDCSRFGAVDVFEDGRIRAFSEKNGKQTGLINAGIYLFECDVIREIHEGENVSLEKEIFPRLLDKGLYGVICHGPFIDIGTPESFYESEKILKNEFKYLTQKEII